MNYGYIIAAGKQSRFKQDTPKALMKIGNKTLLDLNIEKMSKYVDKVFVVCSIENKEYFKDYKNLVIIESGLGSGDAIYKAIKVTVDMDNIPKGSSCYIQWGDSYISSEEIYKQVEDNYRGITIIPCVIEDNPYVQIIKDNEFVNVKFSKYGDETTRGFHDLSLFKCDLNDLADYCKFFIECYYNEKINSYQIEHKEFEFLNLFNTTKINANILEIKNYRSYSFNTVEQYKEIIGEIE